MLQPFLEVLIEALEESPADLAVDPFAFASVPDDRPHSQPSALAIILPQDQRP